MAQPFVIAHRGSSGSAPENTLAAFKKAIDEGADLIELDVHLSKDGKLIVLHDETVRRTTNGKGYIKKLTLEEIKKLDAGSWYDKKFAGETVPELEEVFQLCWGNEAKYPGIKLLIEIKGSPRKYPGIEKELVSLIGKFKAKDRCILQSFNLNILKNIAKIDSSQAIHYLVVGKLFPSGIPSFVRSLNMNQHFITASKVTKLHSQDRTIFAWTVNEEKQMKKMIDVGVDGIITNYPAKLKSHINKVPKP